MRLGLLGGTFNPPHIGHLICAQEALVELGLDQVALVPSRQPPHKDAAEDPGARHRLDLCRAAIAGDERLTVSELEFDRDGPSFTADTLQLLHDQAPDNQLFFILGADAAAGLPRWHEPERILALATLAVTRRRGTPRRRVRRALAGLPGGERTCFFRMPRIGISSTEIRRRVRRGHPVSYLVPPGVAEYIDRHGLYREATGA